MNNKHWKNYINKRVRLIIEDIPYPRPKDGIFIDIDETHIFLLLDNKEFPTPFLRTSVKRVELEKKENKEDVIK